MPATNNFSPLMDFYPPQNNLKYAPLDEALPEKDLAILYLGMCNYELNEWGKALHYYEIYSQFHPEDEDIKFIMNDIRRQIN